MRYSAGRVGRRRPSRSRNQLPEPWPEPVGPSSRSGSGDGKPPAQGPLPPRRWPPTGDRRDHPARSWNTARPQRPRDPAAPTTPSQRGPKTKAAGSNAPPVRSLHLSDSHARMVPYPATRRYLVASRSSAVLLTIRHSERAEDAAHEHSLAIANSGTRSGGLAPCGDIRVRLRLARLQPGAV